MSEKKEALWGENKERGSAAKHNVLHTSPFTRMPPPPLFPPSPHSLHAVHEGDKPFELELAWVCEASGRKFERVPKEVAAGAEAAAKAALADSDMDE